MEQTKTRFVEIAPGKCGACRRCMAACPHNVIGITGTMWRKHAVIENPDACTGCGRCVNICRRRVFTPIEQREG